MFSEGSYNQPQFVWETLYKHSPVYVYWHVQHILGQGMKTPQTSYLHRVRRNSQLLSKFLFTTSKNSNYSKSVHM